MNNFLEENGFETAVEKTVGAILLIITGAVLTLIAVFILMLFTMFPVIMAMATGVPLCLYLVFKGAENKCPLCNEAVLYSDRYKMYCGRYCHQWCAHMLERNEE